MNAVSLIKALENTSSKNGKIALLWDAFKQGERDFFKAAQICYDPTVSFGIKKVALIEDADENDFAPNALTFSDFMLFAHRLRRRELTGNAARDAMHKAAERSNVADWNYFYRRILLKDFKIGVDHKTINKVLNQLGGDALNYVIPVFTCQLAESGDKHPKKLSGKKLLDTKYDGVRLCTVIDIDTQTVTQYTRNGNENKNFTKIRSELAKLIPHLPQSIVLDGEVIGEDFRELMKQLNRGSDVQTDHQRLALFDLVPLADFRKGHCAIPQRKRHEALSELFTSGAMTALNVENVELLPKLEVDLDTDDGRARMEEFRQQIREQIRIAEERGDKTVIEGIMIKDPEAPYVGKKGTHWLKWKPFIEVSLEVIAIEMGDPEGKYGHTVGALVCRGVDDGIYIETNVATGMSDKERDQFRDDPSSIIGRIIEVRADALTQNADAVGTNVYSLRFPSFKGLRGTKPGEKI